MPKIPTTQESVSAQVPSISEYNIPGAVPGAFGGEVGEATEKLGRTAIDVGEMYRQKADQMFKVKNAELENKFMLGLQDIQYGDGTTIIKDANGKDIEVPRGTKLRYGYSSVGSTNDFQEKAFKLRDSLIGEQASAEYKQQLDLQMQRYFISERESQITHESNQIKIADKDTFMQRNKTAISAAVADPSRLPQTMDSLIVYHSEEGQRFGDSPETVSAETDRDMSDAVYKATDSLYRKTLDEAQVMALAESVKDKFSSPDVYQETIDKIEKNLPTIKKTADYNTKLYQVNYEVQSALQLADGMPPQAIDAGAELAKGNFSQEFANAWNLYRDDPITIDALGDPKKEAFVKTLNQAFDAKDKVGLNNALISIFKGGADGKFSQDDAALAIKTIAERSQNIAVLESNKAVQDIYMDKTKQMDIDSGFKTLREWGSKSKISDMGQVYKDYLNHVRNGTPANVAVSSAQNLYVMRQYPQAVTMEEPPNMVIDDNSNIRLIFPKSNTKLYPNRIYKNGKFELNPETHPEAKKK